MMSLRFSVRCGMLGLRFRSPWCGASWSMAECNPTSALRALVCRYVFFLGQGCALALFLGIVVDAPVVVQRSVPMVQTVQLSGRWECKL